MPIDLSIPLGAWSEYARLVSQDRYRALFASDAIGLVIGRSDGTLVEVNETYARMLGYTRDEICRLGWRQITPEDQIAADEAAILSLEREGYAPTYEKEVLHKDGSRLSILIGCTRLSDGDVISFIIDNRGRKRAEAALAELNAELQRRIVDSRNELRSLASHLETVREEQSTRLAREIHDVLGQELTGLRLDAAWIARRLGEGHKSERRRLDDMQTRIDRLVSSVRQIARELRPRILDDLGLAPALEAHAREWSARSGIVVELELPESLEIDRPRATAMFRIFQELLTNVARHAEAQRARAHLYFNAEEQYIGLDFYDDGRGMKTETSSSSLGLLGIRERLITFGGDLVLSSVPDVGTRVHVRMPLGGP